MASRELCKESRTLLVKNNENHFFCCKDLHFDLLIATGFMQHKQGIANILQAFHNGCTKLKKYEMTGFGSLNHASRDETEAIFGRPGGCSCQLLSYSLVIQTTLGMTLYGYYAAFVNIISQATALLGDGPAPLCPCT